MRKLKRDVIKFAKQRAEISWCTIRRYAYHLIDAYHQITPLFFWVSFKTTWSNLIRLASLVHHFCISSTIFSLYVIWSEALIFTMIMPSDYKTSYYFIFFVNEEWHLATKVSKLLNIEIFPSNQSNFHFISSRAVLHILWVCFALRYFLFICNSISIADVANFLSSTLINSTDWPIRCYRKQRTIIIKQREREKRESIVFYISQSSICMLFIDFLVYQLF